MEFQYLLGTYVEKPFSSSSPFSAFSSSSSEPTHSKVQMSIRRKLFSGSVVLLRFAHSKHEPSRVCSRYLFSQSRVVSVPFSQSSFLLNSRVSGVLTYCNNSGRTTGGSMCWNCGAVADSRAPFLACASCRSVQPVVLSLDYFTIFGLEREYYIKDQNLEGKYKDWQKKLHPDLVHTKSEKEKNYAAEQSARVIDAYHTLSKPLSRALYLLHLEGVHVDEEKTLTDPELLAEMMEMREAIEEAGDSQALNQIQSQIQTKLEEWSNSFHKAFKKRDFNDAIDATERMRYYERAIEEIVKKS